jgi:thiamine-monophosphate kinase
MTADPGLGPGREFDLVRAFLAAGGAEDNPDVRVGPGDDCAVVTGDGIALSSDMAVEEVHFRRDWSPPEVIGYRAATAALSDLAAMAARPIGLLASLAVLESDAGEFAERLMAGVREAAGDAGGVLLGGDLVRSPGPLVVDITVVAEATAPVLRSGALPGDEVWVTGRLGGAAAVVAALARGEHPPDRLRERFDRPVARVREALWLAEQGIPAAMLDLSDGLVSDLGHLAAAGEVAIRADLDAVPVHPAARELAGGEEARQAAAAGGEDYELCLATRPGTVAPFADAFEAQFGVPITRVGRVVAGRGVTWLRDGTEIPHPEPTFRHFSGD